MMLKKLLCLALSWAVLAGAALPAAAAGDDTSARLAKVTQRVKEILDLDTEQYEEFHGDYREELAPVWSLYWTGGDHSLMVEALEDGSIVSYQEDMPDVMPYYGRGSNLPVFPADDSGVCREAAEAFLAKVLRDGETVVLEESSDFSGLWRSGSYYRGEILLSGLPSPLNYSLSADSETGRIIRFRRDMPETVSVGGVPSPEAAAEQAKAAAALKETLELRLEYVLGTEDTQTARLRYLPERSDTFYIDAQTGETLNITELEEKMNNGWGLTEDAAAPMATAAGGDMGEERENGLSAVEQAGVQEMEGVLPKEKLDSLVRAETAYGLSGYALASASYNVEKGTDGGPARVWCTLRYRMSSGGDSYSRTVTVDARTGAVERVYSSAPWDRDRVLTEAQAQEKAGAFLKRLCPERADSLENYVQKHYTPSEDTPYFSFRFARKVNGYFFPADVYNVSIDAVTGAVYSLDYDWGGDIAFDSPEGIISMDEALDAWMATYDVTLGYRLVPQKLSEGDGVQRELMKQEREYYYGLRLTYGLEREDYCAGIDAKTGSAEYRETEEEGALAYTDLSGSSARADIEKLAQYGIGYKSGTFRPGKGLTQWDLVCLLASVNGYRLDPETAGKEERDSAYYSVYDMGALTKAERSDAAAVNRGTMVKMLLNGAGYGPAARLEGIFATAYADEASIPAADLGYAAIAQALGLAQGTYGGSRNATRGDAASMLCRILERPVLFP